MTKSQGCARPVFAYWDSDWESVYPVSIFDTETETFNILRLTLRPSSVSNIETDKETFDFENMITLYDPGHTF